MAGQHHGRVGHVVEERQAPAQRLGAFLDGHAARCQEPEVRPVDVAREALSFEFVGEQGFPIALFSGDFLFAGDIGRPDLGFLEMGGMTVEEGAEALRRSLALLDDMPDAT
ncbi:MAG: hypothetical protein ACKOJI_09350, partial [Phycisphaerales bacterium]